MTLATFAALVTFGCYGPMRRNGPRSVGELMTAPACPDAHVARRRG